MRLAKYLANAGVSSRRAAEELVRAGRVQVGDETVLDPARAVGDGDRVTLDGDGVRIPVTRAVYAVNKPAGVVSSARDPQGRPTVVALVPGAGRLYPVGRLDLDTTGLILLTDDGELTHRLTHPRFEVEKTYRARLGHPPIRGATLEKLRRGVELEEGMTAPAKVRRLSADMIELTIHEGRKRQVRRMCESVGHPVHALERVGFGPLRLSGLASGQHRRLSDAELRVLRQAGGLED